MVFSHHLLNVNFFLNILGTMFNMIGTYLVWKNPPPIFPYGYGGASIDYQGFADQSKKKRRLQELGIFIIFIGFIFLDCKYSFFELKAY